MKKLIAFLLSLTLMFSLAVTAFAAESTDFVVLGDSIAHGHGLKDKENYAYGALIAKANGYNYANHAYDGDTTFDLNRRLDRSDIIADLKKAEIIAISIGGNNFLRGGFVEMILKGIFGDYRMLDDISAEFYVNFNIAIDKIKAINPDAEIFIQTVYNPRNDLFKGVYQQALDRLNKYIVQAAAERDLTVIEIEKAFRGHAGEYIQSDVIHPNERGHYNIALEYLKVLKDMGLGTADKPLIDEEEVIVYSVWDQIMAFFQKLFSKKII